MILAELATPIGVPAPLLCAAAMMPAQWVPAVSSSSYYEAPHAVHLSVSAGPLFNIEEGHLWLLAIMSKLFMAVA